LETRGLGQLDLVRRAPYTVLVEPRPECTAMSDLSIKLKTINENKDLISDWEKGFIESVTTQYERNGRLSERQVVILDKVFKKASPDARAERQKWVDSWTEEKKAVLNLIANYYKHSGYFSNMVKKVEDNPDYIPTKNEYEKFCENKWALKVRNNENIAPLWTVGQFAKVRQNAQKFYTKPNKPTDTLSISGKYAYSSRYRSLLDKDVIILGYLNRPDTKKWVHCCLAINPTETFVIREDDLKKSKLNN